MVDQLKELMLDTNVFNNILDGKFDLLQFSCHRLIVTDVQHAELANCSDCNRKAELLAQIKVVAPNTVLTSSFMLDVEGAGLDQAQWSDETGLATKMFERLCELDKKPMSKIINQWSDIAIAETALKRGALLLSNDRKLRQVMDEFGGKAIEIKDLL